jgi:hypothetical protein
LWLILSALKKPETVSEIFLDFLEGD